MLKFFFDRFSKVVLLMEILGVAWTLGWITRDPSFLLMIYVAEYLFLRFCATKRWYRDANRYEGIELQFKKALIPTSYILALVSGVGFFTHSTVLLWMAIPLLGIILHVNILLLYLHHKDSNTTPINFFSGNK